MGFRLKIEGGAAIELKEQSITSVRFRTDIPQDSNARSTDLGSTVEITGKILTAVDGEPFDATKEIGKWALVPAEKADCYRKVTIEVIAASQEVRKYTYPNAFVVVNSRIGCETSLRRGYSRAIDFAGAVAARHREAVWIITGY